jgi:threonine/homoserine/homoserine lactone efflux protein
VNFASLFSGLLLGYSLAVPPGSMNALIAAWSLRSFRHGFAVGAGAMSADFLLMLFTLRTGLSTGQKQLVNLAVAFLTRPYAFLMDEPTSHLDWLNKKPSTTP